MNIILLRPEEVGENDRVVLKGRRLTHMQEILGSEAGTRVRVGVLNGDRRMADVVRMDADAVELALAETLPALPEPKIDLLLALPRPPCLKRVLPQLVAMGVGKLYLTHANKVERDYWGSQMIAKRDFSPLVEEGLEQAGDTRVPEIQLVRLLKPFIKDEIPSLYPTTRKLIAHPLRSGEVNPDVQGLAQDERILLAVGPEGGWTQFELDLFAEHGFERYSLGERVLRTDTACIALLSVLATARI